MCARGRPLFQKFDQCILQMSLMRRKIRRNIHGKIGGKIRRKNGGEFHRKFRHCFADLTTAKINTCCLKRV